MNAPATLHGIIPGLDINAYHGGPGISKSGLDDIARSPFHYYSLHLDPKRPAEEERKGDALEGALLHCALLEPDQFDRRYAVGPDVSRATKAWKEFEAEHAGRQCIKPGQRAAAYAQADSVRRLPEMRDALGRGQAEVSAYWKDPETGVLCRCRPDWVTPVGASDDAVILVDAKTYGSADPAEFARQIGRMAYHRQDAWYRDGYALASGKKVLAFVFAAVETAWPYAATAIVLDDASVEQGRRECRRLVNRYAECLAADRWPSYTESIATVSLPAWAFDKED